jgi:hypothetical protein
VTGIEALVADPEPYFTCPICDGTLYVNQREGRYSGQLEWFYICFHCDVGLGRDGYNAALRERGISPARLKAGDFSQLTGRSVRRKRTEQPPTHGLVAGWHERLLYERRVLAWLKRERGLTRETIDKYQLGYDGQAVVFPVYADGELVSVKRRYWPEPWFRRRGKEVWKRTPSGAVAQLYPDLPAGRWALLCEGEPDALLARQNGLPAVTATCGSQLPPSLVQRLSAQQVAIAYDVGAEVAAERAAERLIAAGGQAVVVPLGLPNKGDDLTDWFLTYGRTARELVGLIRKAARS